MPLFRRVCPCVRSFSERRVCTHFACESKRGVFVSEVENRDEKWFEMELVAVTFWRYLRERFWTKNRTLQKVFQVAKAVRKYNKIKRGAPNWAPLSLKAPQCGAFRGFETAV